MAIQFACVLRKKSSGLSTAKRMLNAVEKKAFNNVFRGEQNSSDGSPNGSARVFKSAKEANDFFGVRFQKSTSFWDDDKYDHDASNGVFKDWYNNATRAERNAVITYTGSAFDYINNYLRGVSSDLSDHHKETISRMDSAMKKFNLPQAITVYRGSSTKLFGGAGTVEALNSMKGTIVRDKGFVSTSVYQGAQFEKKLILEIKYPKGRGRGIYAAPISSHQTEWEFIGARNTDFKIMGARRDEYGNTIVRLNAVYGKKRKQ